MIVEPYNPAWPLWFGQLQSFLAEYLQGIDCSIEHVGSTSVPGMVAKPIIDIDVALGFDVPFEAAKARLESAGYVHQGDIGIKGREAFDLVDAAVKATLPAHHLYVCAANAAELRRHRAFRDFLRTNADWAGRLSSHKLELAVQLGDDRAAYQDAKSAMVRKILALAMSEARTA